MKHFSLFYFIVNLRRPLRGGRGLKLLILKLLILLSCRPLRGGRGLKHHIDCLLVKQEHVAPCAGGVD